MSHKLTTIVEDIILGRLIATMLDHGYRIEMSDQDGGGLYLYVCDAGATALDGGYSHWVRLVPGNGADLIVDYTQNLETVMEPINDLASAWW